MRETSDLIDALVDSATPVRRLRPPLLRAALWLALAAGVLGLLCIAHGMRADISIRLQQPVFVVSMVAALVTAILAAWASFKLSLPDSSRWWLLLPAPALAVWVSTIGYGCLTDWVTMSPDGVRMGEAVRCFATLLLTSVPLSIAMLIMLRHAALLRPTVVCAAGGLAIAAMTSFALSLIHDLDATIMILIWNLGVAALIAGLAGAFGRSVLAWIAARVMPALPPQLTRS
ncbi:MAG TPA: DUF1109 domain-containing protein [Acetobacteraceae bacterium]|jgi:hypothetical protein|nr:DUF1109 domain-containing protein [Acetobacteraceae bacterium]